MHLGDHWIIFIFIFIRYSYFLVIYTNLLKWYQCVSFLGYLFVFDGIPNAYLNSPSNCGHFDITYMPFQYSCMNSSSSLGPSRCNKASVQKKQVPDLDSPQISSSFGI